MRSPTGVKPECFGGAPERPMLDHGLESPQLPKVETVETCRGLSTGGLLNSGLLVNGLFVQAASCLQSSLLNQPCLSTLS